MRIIIDRLEEDFAVAQLNEKTYNIPRALLPEAKEGDTVEITVLGRLPLEDREPPHAIFERLHRNSRGKDAPHPKHHRRMPPPMDHTVPGSAESPDSTTVSQENNADAQQENAENAC